MGLTNFKSKIKWIANIKIHKSAYLGNLNWPFSEPSVPNELSTRPLTSNTCTRWLLESLTMTLFVLETAM